MLFGWDCVNYQYCRHRHDTKLKWVFSASIFFIYTFHNHRSIWQNRHKYKCSTLNLSQKIPAFYKFSFKILCRLQIHLLCCFSNFLVYILCIGEKSSDDRNILKSIFVLVTQNHPNYALWTIVSCNQLKTHYYVKSIILQRFCFKILSVE